MYADHTGTGDVVVGLFLQGVLIECLRQATPSSRLWGHRSLYPTAGVGGVQSRGYIRAEKSFGLALPRH